MNPLKLVLIGSGGVGKSALAVRYLQGRFVEKYDPTIEDSHTKEFILDGEKRILEIMDTAGQEEYSALRDHFMRTGEGFMIVYSISSSHSFEMATRLRNQILRIKETDNVPIVLVGNKSDLEDERQVTREEGKIIAQKWAAAFIEVSAKTDSNVEEAFQMLVQRTVQGKEFSPRKGKKIRKEKCCIM